MGSLGLLNRNDRIVIASLMSTVSLSFVSKFAKQHGCLHGSVGGPNRCPSTQMASAMSTAPEQLASPVETGEPTGPAYLTEIPDNLKSDLKFRFVERVDEVLKLALGDGRAPRKTAKKGTKKAQK